MSVPSVSVIILYSFNDIKRPERCDNAKAAKKFPLRFFKKIRNFAPTVTKTAVYEQNSTFYRREAGRSQKLRVQRELEKYAIICIM